MDKINCCKDIDLMFSDRVKKMDINAVRKMFALAGQVKDPINLTIGLPNFDVPQEIKDEAKKAIENGRNGYTQTQGILELREAIVHKLFTKNNINVNSNQIIITNAVSAGISITFSTLLNAGDEVIIIDPYFVLYKQVVEQYGGVPVVVKAKADFSLDLDAIEEVVTSKTKAILINSPNNPTGKVYSRAELDLLVGIAKRNGLFIVSDEIYEDFTYEGEHFSPASIYDRVITLNGFSKSWGMSGWRVGYMVGPQEFMDQAVKIAQLNYVCAPTPFQWAAVKALSFDMSEQITDYKKKRDLVFSGLVDAGYDVVFPNGAFYFFVKYPYDSEKFLKRCFDNKLLVVPGNGFSEGNTHFRISFCQEDVVLRNALVVFNKISRL